MIPHIVLVFPFLVLNKQMSVGLFFFESKFLRDSTFKKLKYIAKGIYKHLDSVISSVNYR